MKNIKSIAFLLMVCGILFLGMMYQCERKKVIKKTQAMTELTSENEFLKSDKKIFQDSLAAEKKKREVMEAASVVLIKERDQLLLENKLLRKKYSNVPEWVNKLPVDSSYDFIRNIAYPFPGELKYPLNESQIKGTHSTFLQNQTLDELVINQEKLLTVCESRVDNALAKAESFKNSLALCGDQKNVDVKTIQNLESINSILEKDLKKTVNKRNFWRTTSFISIGGIIILLL